MSLDFNDLIKNMSNALQLLADHMDEVLERIDTLEKETTEINEVLAFHGLDLKSIPIRYKKFLPEESESKFFEAKQRMKKYADLNKDGFE